MKIKNIVDENFQDYRKASIFIGTATCDWKCCKECGQDICQNLPLATSPTIEISDIQIVKRYLENELTSAIVIGGLEPLDQFDELLHLVEEFRAYTIDDIVIYTGYREDEAAAKIELLAAFPAIIVKFGRYVPNQSSRYDDVLGVTLASPNQYARRIS